MRKTLRQKIRIFNLEGLRDIESKKFLSKIRRNNHSMKLFKAKFLYSMILNKNIQ